MKIAMISNQAQSMLNFRGPLIVELIRGGHEVICFAPNFDTKTRSAISALGANTVGFEMSRSGTNPFQELAVIFKLRALLREHQPEICFTFFLKPVIYGTLAAWSAGIERRYGLIEGLGFSFTAGSEVNFRMWILQRFLKVLARFAALNIDKMIFLNEDDKKEFIDSGIVKSEKTALLGAIGVDLDEWSVQPLPEGQITFILVARLLGDKGIREYVQAARIVSAENPKVRFLLLGGLDENPAAISRSEVNAWVTEGLIEWPGHVAVKPWLGQSSVFVLPSYREGLPCSTQEAMALGRPVITTDAPGCRETVIEGYNGFLIPPRDPAALANAMQHFIEHPQDISKMGANSRKLAEEKFNVQIQNGKLLEFLGLR